MRTKDEAMNASGQYWKLAWQCCRCGEWHPADHEGFLFKDGRSACVACGDKHLIDADELLKRLNRVGVHSYTSAFGMYVKVIEVIKNMLEGE